jgi:integrase
LTNSTVAITIGGMALEQLELWNRPAQVELPRRRLHAVASSPEEGNRGDEIGPPEPAQDLDTARVLELLQQDADGFVLQAIAESTREIYAGNWKRFEAWCCDHGQVPLPASPDTLALYITHLVKLGLGYGTLRRVLFAIARAHVDAEAGRPDRAVRVRKLMRGIGRTIGTREEGAKPLRAAELASMVRALGTNLLDTRDRALLLLGFIGAYRASDLAGLEVANLRFQDEGVSIFLKRSKEDQLGRGCTTLIPLDVDPELCAVRALRGWLERAVIDSGPLFRAVGRSTARAGRIHRRTVARAVQRAAALAGLEGHYSAHSLRAGLATEAHAHGWSLPEIQHWGRWDFAGSVSRYIDVAAAPRRRNVVSGFTAVRATATP